MTINKIPKFIRQTKFKNGKSFLIDLKLKKIIKSLKQNGIFHPKVLIENFFINSSPKLVNSILKKKNTIKILTLRGSLKKGSALFFQDTPTLVNNLLEFSKIPDKFVKIKNLNYKKLKKFNF